MHKKYIRLSAISHRIHNIHVMSKEQRVVNIYFGMAGE